MTDAGTERFRVIFLLITAVSSGGAATSLCFDGNSSFQKQGCLCQAEDMYTAQILCPFLEGELPPPMSQNYSNVNTLVIKSGSITTLSRNNLISYPNLIQLAISNTALKHIDQDAFLGMSMTSVTLEYNRLVVFPPVANLTQLHMLSVEGNQISSITKADLLNLKNLITLNLGSNQITELPMDVFDYTCHLTNLSLSNNNIKEFQDGTFNSVIISTLDLSNTKVTKLPTDGIRDYLKVIDLSGATQLALPSFTTSDASHYNLTYPLLKQITMPFHIYCCQLESQKIKHFQIKSVSTKKRQGSLPEPTPSSPSTLKNCNTSTVVNTVCTTKSAPLNSTVPPQSKASNLSTNLVTQTMTSMATLLSITPSASVPSNVATIPSSSVVLSGITLISQSDALSIDYVSTVAPSASLLSPIATILLSSEVLFSEMLASTISQDGSELPSMPTTTGELSATPVVSCYTEAVVMLCCNKPAPVDCSNLCDSTTPTFILCLSCYADSCPDSGCSLLASAMCACLTAQSSEGSGNNTHNNTPVCTPLALVSSSPSPVPKLPPFMPISPCRNGTLPPYEESDEYITCLPAEDPFNPCEELLSDGPRIVIWIVIPVTLFGNGLVITCMVVYVVIFRKKQNQLQVVNFLYLNLAIADFLMGVYLFTIGVEDLHTHYSSPNAFYAQSEAWMNSHGCNFAGFCAMTSTSMSVFTLVLITLERVYSIVQVFARNKMSLKVAALLVGLGWVFAVVMGALPIVHVSSYGKTALCLPFDNSSPVSAGYVYFVLIMTGIASFVIAISYAVIGCSVFCNRRTSGSPANASKMNECYVAMRMGIIVFTSFACWFPIAVVALGTASGQHLIDVSAAKVFMVVVFPLNASLNPVIYTLSTRVFRETLLMMTRKCGATDIFYRLTSGWSSQPQTRETTSTLRRLSLSKTSTTDLFASSARSNLISNNAASVEGGLDTLNRRVLGATNMMSLSAIREATEFDDPASLVIRNECTDDSKPQTQSVIEIGTLSATMETSFDRIIIASEYTEE